MTLSKNARNISIAKFDSIMGESVLDILFYLSAPSPKPGFKAFQAGWYNQYISGINTRDYLLNCSTPCTAMSPFSAKPEMVLLTSTITVTVEGGMFNEPILWGECRKSIIICKIIGYTLNFPRSWSPCSMRYYKGKKCIRVRSD
ncbi:hypothetical protein H109_03451 [Trichophyton interdigitale MR816]|uniref:Uncharacterized protein n=1 Tax=Trichophyton interdigitale (strain MR816) TaxID=1215338 RepID=A0A059JAN8_TRIIM|nr:hypothetical protein H109_03451 [Trichophyton interdigitale MR816]